MFRISREMRYSQNLIRSPLIVKRLLDKSRISYSDNVIEIGAGKGIITKELAKRCKSVIAYEIDPILFKELCCNLNPHSNVKLLNEDFLKTTMPKNEYKVFSNIPFNFTSRIMRRLLTAENTPSITYLIVQREVAEKYAGLPRETQVSLLIKPLFKIVILDKLHREDFAPKPRVKSALLEIEKWANPLIQQNLCQDYCDFIVYATTQWKPTISESLKKVFTKKQLIKLSENIGFSLSANPLDVSFEHWLALFTYFTTHVDQNKRNAIKGSYIKQLQKQKSLKKTYRTR